MNNYFERNHPTSSPPAVGEATFRCCRCKESHAILGSKQRWSAVLRKFKRYGIDCYTEMSEKRIKDEN